MQIAKQNWSIRFKSFGCVLFSKKTFEKKQKKKKKEILQNFFFVWKLKVYTSGHYHYDDHFRQNRYVLLCNRIGRIQKKQNIVWFDYTTDVDDANKHMFDTKVSKKKVIFVWN